jgi:hypothetical protein
MQEVNSCLHMFEIATHVAYCRAIYPWARPLAFATTNARRQWHHTRLLKVKEWRGQTCGTEVKSISTCLSLRDQHW